MTPIPQPVAFDGLGFGWLLTHLLETTANSLVSYSCAVYVLESDPLALAMLLHMHDYQAVIEQKRVRWFISDQAGEVMQRFDAALRENGHWSLPGRFVRVPLRQREALAIDA